jgi:four helix bundle protein
MDETAVMARNPNAEPVRPQLEHERLEVYAIALQFHALACGLLPRRGCRSLRDQLERASLGVVLNIAEGAGRRSSPDKRRFYEMARGSATESAAIVDVLRLRALAPPAACCEARLLVVRIVQMLSRLAGPVR